MSLYTLALFAHLVGVLSLFIGMGLQWTVIVGFRRAQSISQMRLWSGLLRPVAMLGPLSAVLILLAGGYMMFIHLGYRHTMDCCLDRRDAADGGARYGNHGPQPSRNPADGDCTGKVRGDFTRTAPSHI